MKSLPKKLIFVLGAVFGFLLGGSLIYFNFSKGKQNETPNELKITRIQPASNEYKFISPLLAYDINEQASPQFENLKNELDSYISDQRKTNKVDKVSVYFRADSSSIGIGENDNYKPGSLFKVPIMIAYLKQAESDPSLLQKKLKFSNPNQQAAEQNIPPLKHVEFGHEYTVEELIDYMIVYSDNSAANILAEGIYLNQKNSYTEILADLGLPAFTEEISAKKYALFLRILRNATYLNREMSEKAMSILAQSDYKDGLVAGIPNLVIAHKFGEVGIEQNGKLIEQLHECGIIYYPNHPYLLCIMTQGSKVSDLEQVISKISQITYEEINKLDH